MSRKIDRWNEEDDDYMEKIPSRFQSVVRKPQQESIPHPDKFGWSWD